MRVESMGKASIRGSACRSHSVTWNALANRHSAHCRRWGRMFASSGGRQSIAPRATRPTVRRSSQRAPFRYATRGKSRRHMDGLSPAIESAPPRAWAPVRRPGTYRGPEGSRCRVDTRTRPAGIPRRARGSRGHGGRSSRSEAGGPCAHIAPGGGSWDEPPGPAFNPIYFGLASAAPGQLPGRIRS